MRPSRQGEHRGHFAAHRAGIRQTRQITDRQGITPSKDLGNAFRSNRPHAFPRLPSQLNCMKCNLSPIFRVCGESARRAYGAGLSGILSQKLSKGLVFGPALLFCPLRIARAAGPDSPQRSLREVSARSAPVLPVSKTLNIPFAARTPGVGMSQSCGNPPEMQFHQAEPTQFRHFAHAIGCVKRNYARFFRICSKTCLTA